MTLQILAAMIIAVLIVGVFAGCATTAPDMTQAEVISIMDFVIIMEKHNERKMQKR